MIFPDPANLYLSGGASPQGTPTFLNSALSSGGLKPYTYLRADLTL